MLDTPAGTIHEETEEETSVDLEVAGKPPLPTCSTNDSKGFAHPQQVTNAYEWRIDLSKTERYWTGWFRGLSQKFLDVPAPKVLLLANIQGLDTTLTIGQMQGNKLYFKIYCPTKIRPPEKWMICNF